MLGPAAAFTAVLEESELSTSSASRPELWADNFTAGGSG